MPKSNTPAYLVLPQGTCAIPDPQVTAMLTGMGYQAGYANYDSTLNMDFLQQFNLVVVTSVPVQDNTAVNALLMQYVQAGGGLLVLGSAGNSDQLANVNGLLNPSGIQILQEQVMDNTNYDTVPFTQVYWTDNITADTVTENVTGIFYPNTTNINIGIRDFPGPDIKRELADSSLRHEHRVFNPGINRSGNGTYNTNPPLLAVCEYGRAHRGLAHPFVVYMD